MNHINKSENTVEYDFSVTAGLKKYFSEKPYLIEYPENMENVPDAVLAVPFVCNILPIVWLSNSTIILNEIDKDFSECIPNVKSGYEEMFPEASFGGDVCVENIIDSSSKCKNDGCAMLFSGGLDAVNTLISHFNENPILISIWGADVKFDNSEGWQKTLNGIEDAAAHFGMKPYVIHSSFREFDYEGILNTDYCEQLKDNWWHGIKHSLALLGHTAPVVYLHGLSKVYIASSNCSEDTNVRCASNPITDNRIRFSGASVIHDGYEYSRQKKAQNVVEFVKNTNNRISLHVCWQSQAGQNCCKCEKCYRTMAALLAEGADPTEYGFFEANQNLPRMRDHIYSFQNRYILKNQWLHISNRVKENRESLVNTPYWKYISWLEKADFSDIDNIKTPVTLKIRQKLSNYKFYRKLHNLKAKFGRVS